MDTESGNRGPRGQLRITGTNSGTDSDGGKVSGLSLNNFMLVVAGGVVSIIVLGLSMTVPALKELGFMAKVGVAFCPLVVSFAYTMFFFHDKPPGYHGDVYDELFSGTNFNTEPLMRGQVEHPLVRAARKSGELAANRKAGVTNKK